MKQMISLGYYDDRACYIDKDGNYVYEVYKLDEKGKYVPAKVVIEADKDTTSIIAFLAEDDEKDKKQLRRNFEHEDMRYKKKKLLGGNEDGEEYVNPIETISDGKDVFNELFGEEKETDDSRYKEFLTLLKDEDKFLIEEHLINRKSLQKIADETGKNVDALESRWCKIRRKTSKFYGTKKNKRNFCHK